MTRTRWAVGGAVGMLVAGLLCFVVVRTHQDSVTAARSAQQIVQIQATAAVETSRAAAAATEAGARASAAGAQARRRTELLARATIDAYFQSINAANYRTAFDLGGHNFSSSFASFRAGFDNTAYDEWDITGVSGDRVYLTLTAYNLDCTTQVWRGYYVVTDGELVRAHLTGGSFQDGKFCD